LQALRRQADVAAAWIAMIVDGVYHAPLRPMAEKRGLNYGANRARIDMNAIIERQDSGGSAK
jgi:hypothetical protein